MKSKPFFRELMIILLQAIGIEPMPQMTPVRVRATNRFDEGAARFGRETHR